MNSGASIGLACVVASRSIMTVGFAVERPDAYCGDCRGKGFALTQGKNRHSRKCQRCRGKGSVAVGSTKR